jgi:hypothetical protein
LIVVPELNQHPLVQMIRIIFHFFKGLGPQTVFSVALGAATVFSQIQTFGFVFEPSADGVAVAVLRGHGGITNENNSIRNAWELDGHSVGLRLSRAENKAQKCANALNV